MEENKNPQNGKIVLQPSEAFKQELKTQQESTLKPEITPSLQAEPTSQSPSPNPASIYPDAQNSSSTVSATTTPIGLTGSQLQPEKIKIPVGIYIIAGFNLLGFAVSFFDSSQNSGIYSIVMLVDLLLAIGLLFRLEVARKVIVWLAGVTLILTVINVAMLFALQQRLHELRSNYDSAISRIDQARLTLAQKQQLEAMNTAIAQKEKQAGKAISFTYVKLGATAVGSVVIIIYLTRPRIKEVFRDLES